MSKHWVQTCFAQSQMDCYYFGCVKRDKCEQFKNLDSHIPLKERKIQNESENYHND